MMKMQRLQPQVERIRERYKNEQEKLHHEMMELYKRNHVNPMGGCLPMVIQFPVFIGLYEALLNAVELRNAPFIGWIRDLAAPDCLPIPGVTVPFTDLHGIPVLVLLSFVVGTTHLTLVLPALLVASLGLTAILSTIIIYDGESTWLEGLALIGLYGIIAVSFWWG